MHDVHREPEPDLTFDESLEAMETFGRQLFRSADRNQNLRRQLAEAERVLGLIKGAETVEGARSWARTYFGEETRTA